MNDLTNITTATALTMSSVDIAAYTGKRHDNVIRDIRAMASELGLSLTFEEKRGTGGRPVEIVHLPKRETLILVTGYSIEKRAAVIDRWQELESLVSSHRPSGLVTDLAAEVRTAIGGITKGIVHKELTEIIPALVRSELASQALAFRRGQTSGQIWRGAGFPRMRVTSWFSNRLCEMGCQIEGGGRGELGLGTAKLFDPDKAELWLKNGGRTLVEAYIKERQGQSTLRLVGGRAS